MRHTVQWMDGGNEPQNEPHPDYPDYPDGIDLDCTAGRVPACTVALPYPAKRGGYYRVECQRCGIRAAITTAGRADDPRSIKMPCKTVTQGMARA